MLGFPLQTVIGQLLLGLINGSFYAILSLGLAIIFGLLNIINFAHGTLYMLGAYVAWALLTYAGVSYWGALIIAPLVVGIFGILLERLFLKGLYKLEHLFGLLMTLALSLIIEGVMQNNFGVSGQAYEIPEILSGSTRLGNVVLPIYRSWVVVASLVVCIGTWWIIEKTKLGSYLRACTENPELVGTFGIRVPRLIMLTYGAGVALAGFAGVLAAPVYSISPHMGSDLMIVVFAVVVIGGMGSIMGSIVTGYLLGIAEGLTRLIYPEASAVIVFIIMGIVLIFKPNGLFGGRE
ncbi:MAG: branched-chain amino acid ABC transporter permease [Burkholderiaceae bacterium]